MLNGRRAGVLAVAGALSFVAACGSQGAASRDPGCGEGRPVTGRQLRIATTVAPITSIVGTIVGGSGAAVVGVVPEGRNSHTFEPSPSVAATLEEADIVFLNGLSLEEPTRELALANLRDGGELCELGTTVLPAEAYVFDFSFPEAGGKPNPHLWTNPPMARQYAQLVLDVLVARDPAHAGQYRANFEAFAAQIDELDGAIRSATSTVPTDQRLLLTYHDAYAYFALEYGWTVLGAVQPSSFDEPSPRDVAALIEQVESTGVRAIFGSEVFPSPVLRQIAVETGVDYVDDLRDDDLLGSPGDAEHSWLALMRFNYVTIVEALGGDASSLRSLDVTSTVIDRAEYPQ
jgi:ABC-type Zn uptake system ZnuABC Zn-binding protein ZnuA